VLLSAWRMASAADALPVLVALGLGGPLWFYAVSGWEHAPAVAFGAAAFACAVRARSGIAPISAGLLLGAGATLRDEVLLLLPGLMLVVWLRFGAAKAIMLTVAGSIVPVVATAAVEVWWFQRPVAAHLRHAVHLLQSAFRVTNTPNPDLPSLEPFTLRQRYETVIQYWLLGYGDDRWIAMFAGALAVALLIRWELQSSLGIVVWIGAVLVMAAIDLRELVSAPKWLAGLHRVSPYFVFALLPLPAAARAHNGARDWVPAAFLFTAAAYVALAFAGVDTTGGKSLGPRLLLPLFPLLAVSSVARIRYYLRAGAPVDRWIGRVGAALVVMAVAMHLFGTIPAYRARNQDDAAAVIAIGASRERIVVSDDPFTAQLLFPLYYRKIVFLADSPDLGVRIGSRMVDEHVASAILVSRRAEPLVSLAPLRLDRIEQRGRMLIQYWRR
jgi:hypothetical protein